MEKQNIDSELAEVLLAIKSVIFRIAKKVDDLSEMKGEECNGKDKASTRNYSRIRPTYPTSNGY